MGAVGRISRWLEDVRDGSGRYLSSVFVAVLLAPVLPDIAVDIFGADNPGWLNPTLRGGAVATVFVLCVGVFRVQRWRLVRAGAARMHSLPSCDVLVLPVSKNSTYRAPGQQSGDHSIPEYLVNQTSPKVVVAVATQETADRLGDLLEGLEAQGITAHSVLIDDPYDPKATVQEIPDKVGDLIAENELTNRRTCVDITGGTVAMSLGLLRLATLRGAECVYVASEYDGERRQLRTQHGRTFDPRDLFGG